MVCDRFDLRFDAVVSAEEVDGPGKPEPHVYHHAADELGVSSIDCVAVEDSVPGVQSATAAGMTCVAYQPEGGNLYLSAMERVVGGPDELRAELLD
jgi:beta-phosphoglucomutase-like phosphatase (HAD superfamily)